MQAEKPSLFSSIIFLLMASAIIFGIHKCNSAKEPNKSVCYKVELERLTLDDEADFYLSWNQDGEVRSRYNATPEYDIIVKRRKVKNPLCYIKGTIVHRPWLTDPKDAHQLEDRFFEVIIPMDYKIKYVAD